jgi:hypothetical protein
MMHWLVNFKFSCYMFAINNIHVYNPNLKQFSSRNQYRNSAVHVSMYVEYLKIFGLPELEIYVHI